jgi:hypothetical protein
VKEMLEEEEEERRRKRGKIRKMGSEFFVCKYNMILIKLQQLVSYSSATIWTYQDLESNRVLIGGFLFFFFFFWG